MKPRFRIAGLVAAVAFCGLAFAALHSPSQLWANVLYSALSITLIIATIRVVFDRGESRAFWTGFLIAAGSYFVVYSVSPLRESICPRLVTEPLLDVVFPQVVPDAPPRGETATVFAMASLFRSINANAAVAPVPASAAPDRWGAWTQPDWWNGTGYPVGSIALVTSETFRQIGHSLMIMLMGVFGGYYARTRYRVTRRSTTA